MDNLTAEMISRKTRALKHCVKLLDTIEKRGSTVIKLSATGVEFTIQKNDAIYLRLQTTKAQLAEELGSYDIVKTTQIRTVPTPVCACDEESHKAEIAREKKRVYMREYNAKHREEKKAYMHEYNKRNKKETKN